jgi:hypothetical protein
MTGALVLPPSVPTIADLLLPLAIGVTEFLLFAVLLPQVTPFSQLNTAIEAWFWVMAVFAAIAILITFRARHILSKAIARGIYGRDVRSTVEDYLPRLSVLGPGLNVILAVAGGVLRLTDVTGEWLSFLIVISIILLIIGGLRDHGSAAELWRNLLAAEPEPPPTGRRDFSLADALAQEPREHRAESVSARPRRRPTCSPPAAPHASIACIQQTDAVIRCSASPNGQYR